MLYCTWDMVRDIKLFFSLGYFLSFYTPNNLKNQNFKKKVKKRLEISSFYTCVPKMMIRWCMGPEIWYATDGRMDGKSDIEVGAPPKKINISNRVQLSLGWKKAKQKRIVNQILLSKLWYIGQIYTIPKFIKEEIGKTIAQLSIWKCGLGILDIDTQ